MRIDGRTHEFPDITFVDEIAEGANGVVFAARDSLLDRRIAVKIWKARGVARSQLETKKIANISHPLFVTTHRFGRSDDGHPFAVMEFIDGQSAKSWLHESRSLSERIAVWRLYSRALTYLYGKGVLHGDPHLGNVIIFDDDGEDEHLYPDGIALKIADTGTSAFWDSRRNFIERESEIIVEVASLLFRDQPTDKLLAISDHIPPSGLLRIFNAFASVVGHMKFNNEPYAYSIVAGAIVNEVIKCPFFDLDELLDFARVSPGTTANRVMNRLNWKLDQDRSNSDNWAEELTDKTRFSYENAKMEFLAEL
ncbi:MAG: protein kinase [bacterium]|nr:protein kinase [bacterium]